MVLSCVFLVQFLCGYSRVLVILNFLLHSDTEPSPAQVVVEKGRNLIKMFLFSRLVLSSNAHVLTWWTNQFFSAAWLPLLEPDQEPGGLLYALHDSDGFHALHLSTLAVQAEGSDFRTCCWRFYTSSEYLRQ